MLRLRSATKASLKAILLASAVLVSGFVSQANASTVKLRFGSVTSGTVVNVNGNPGAAAHVSYSSNAGANWSSYTQGGQFNWRQINGPNTTYNLDAHSQYPAAQGTVNMGGSPTTYQNANVTTFCIELAQHIGTGTNYIYTVSANIASLPKPGNGMGPSRAQLLQTLVNGYGLFKAGTPLLGFPNLLLPNVAYATLEQAMQGAIWEIVHETDSTVPNSANSGNFRLKDNVSDTKYESNVNALLTWATNHLLPNNANQVYFAIGLTSQGGSPGNQQDQIAIVNREGFIGGGGTIVPVPAGVLMAGMGVICLGGLNYFRRRKVAIIA